MSEWPVYFAWVPLPVWRLHESEHSVSGGWWVPDGFVWLKKYRLITNVWSGDKTRVRV